MFKFFNNKKNIIPDELDLTGCRRNLSECFDKIEYLKKEKLKFNLGYNLFEAIFKKAQFIILILDEQGNIVRFNPYMEKLSGYKLSEVKGKSWFSTFLSKKDYAEVKGLFSKAIKNIKTDGNINLIIKKNGESAYIEWFNEVLKDENEKIINLMCIGRDVSYNSKAEKDASQTEQRYRLLFNSSQDVLIYINKYGYVIDINDRVKDFGYTPQEIIGHHLSYFSHIFSKKTLTLAVANYAKRMAGINVSPYEIEATTKNKDRNFYMEVNTQILRDDNGRMSGGFALLHDVTERRIAEDKFKKQNEELYKLNKLMVGRELKMVELKKEIDKLKSNIN